MGLKASQPLQQKTSEKPTVQGNVKFNRTLEEYPPKEGDENIATNDGNVPGICSSSESNLVVFNSGIIVQYPDQDPKRHAEILTEEKKDDYSPNEITLRNMTGATIFTTPQSDIVTLEGCTDCFVVSSAPDRNPDRVFIEDNGKYLSHGNKVALSDDCVDGIPMDMVKIDHNSNERFTNYTKYYFGAEEREPHPMDWDGYEYVNATTGVKTVRESDFVGLKQIWVDFKNWYIKHK